MIAYAPPEGGGDEQRGDGDQLAGAQDGRQHHPQDAEQTGGQTGMAAIQQSWPW